MRKALGRGLDALLPSVPSLDGIATTTGSVAARKIPISSIRPNHLQPRKTFDPQKLAELADSIKSHGLAQPILVSYDAQTNSYELIAGERRLRASQLAGLAEIDAVVRNPQDDRERLALALIENLQRDDLNPIDVALSYLRLMKEFGLTQTELGPIVGKSRPSISNAIRLLDLPEEVQKALQMGDITEGHARALLQIEDPIKRHTVFKMIVEQGLSVRDVESFGQPEPEPQQAPAPARKRRNQSADEKALEESLQQLLGTRVQIKARPSGRGTITIHYTSLEDFDRIVGNIKK